jgi:hypothetical protein
MLTRLEYANRHSTTQAGVLKLNFSELQIRNTFFPEIFFTGLIYISVSAAINFPKKKPQSDTRLKKSTTASWQIALLACSWCLYGL